jgi:hypothetical protein
VQTYPDPAERDQRFTSVYRVQQGDLQSRNLTTWVVGDIIILSFTSALGEDGSGR